MNAHHRSRSFTIMLVVAVLVVVGTFVWVTVDFAETRNEWVKRVQDTEQQAEDNAERIHQLERQVAVGYERIEFLTQEKVRIEGLYHADRERWGREIGQLRLRAYVLELLYPGDEAELYAELDALLEANPPPMPGGT